MEPFVDRLMKEYKLSRKDAEDLAARLVSTGQVKAGFPRTPDRNEPVMLQQDPQPVEREPDPSAWALAPKWGQNDFIPPQPDPWANERVRPRLPGTVIGSPVSLVYQYLQPQKVKYTPPAPPRPNYEAQALIHHIYGASAPAPGTNARRAMEAYYSERAKKMK